MGGKLRGWEEKRIEGRGIEGRGMEGRREELKGRAGREGVGWFDLSRGLESYSLNVSQLLEGSSCTGNILSTITHSSSKGRERGDGRPAGCQGGEEELSSN